MTKRVARIKCCVLFNSEKTRLEQIIAFLEKRGFYNVTIVGTTTLKEAPSTWKPPKEGKA